MLCYVCARTYVLLFPSIARRSPSVLKSRETRSHRHPSCRFLNTNCIIIIIIIICTICIICIVILLSIRAFAGLSNNYMLWQDLLIDFQLKRHPPNHGSATPIHYNTIMTYSTAVGQKNKISYFGRR